jgi:hypothetical protein
LEAIMALDSARPPARVIALPTAAAEPVVNPHERGHLPASIPVLFKARWAREEAQSAAELHTKRLRDKREIIAAFEEHLARNRQELFVMLGAQQRCSQ